MSASWSDGWDLDQEGNRVRFNPGVTEIGGKSYVPISAPPEEYAKSPIYASRIASALQNGDVTQQNGQWYMSTDLQGQLSKIAGVGQEGGLAGALNNGAGFWALAAGFGSLAAGGGLAGYGAAEGAGGAGGIGLGASDIPASYSNMLAEGGATLSDAPSAAAGSMGSEITSFNQYLPQNFTQSFPGISTAGSSGLIPGASSGGMFSGISSAISRIAQGQGTAEDAKAVLSAGGTAVALAGGAVAVSKLASGGLGGSTSTTQTTNLPALSQEERDLISLNAQLTQRQLSAIDQMQPFQKALLEQAMSELQSNQQLDTAFNAAVSPEDQAAAYKAEFDRAKRLGPVQEELSQLQLDAVRRNGAATPEQQALIKSAADRAIEAGSSDIDLSTQRGIGLIADELANSRGLRMSDTPITREATLLARSGQDQKASLTKNLRSTQATSELNYPLAVQGLTSNIATSQQNVAQAAQQFQQELRQRAFQNRMALTGQGTSTGIGLSSVGGGNAALSALTQSRLNSGSTTTDVSKGIGLSDVGNLAGGIGSAIYGYSKLFPG